MLKNPFIIQNNYFDARSVINDYCQFSKEKKSQVIKRIRKSREIASKAWNRIVNEKSQKSFKRFYASKDYIYDLLSPFYFAQKFNKIKTCLNIIKFINKYPGGKVLEFGGGTGELCLLLYFNTQKSIAYLDLPGKTFDFARWRFKKYNASIKMIKSEPATPNIPGDPYDFIVSDAVLEHVQDLELSLAKISKALALPGWLYLLFDPNTSQKYPMHLNNAADFYAILKRLKLLRTSRFLWTNSKTVDAQINSILFQTKQQSSQMIFMIRKYLGQIKKLITKSEKGPTFTVY